MFLRVARKKSGDGVAVVLFVCILGRKTNEVQWDVDEVVLRGTKTCW